ncbi:MAG: hypothetical protein AVDCRST_MAG30-203, partial [uncultured Solirubrobacteraceae bacterium]
RRDPQDLAAARHARPARALLRDGQGRLAAPPRQARRPAGARPRRPLAGPQERPHGLARPLPVLVRLPRVARDVHLRLPGPGAARARRPLRPRLLPHAQADRPRAL